MVVLPEKHFSNSVTKRHEKLRVYLEGVITIKDAYKIYAINLFLNKNEESETNKAGISVVRQPSYIDEDNW
jgi:hypothetical protein